MTPKIEIKRDYQAFRIYINDLLHLQIIMSNHDGVQTWYEGTQKRMYFIEFYRKEGQPIQLTYDEVGTWKEIIKLIDSNI